MMTYWHTSISHGDDEPIRVYVNGARIMRIVNDAIPYVSAGNVALPRNWMWVDVQGC